MLGRFDLYAAVLNDGVILHITLKNSGSKKGVFMVIHRITIWIPKITFQTFLKEPSCSYCEEFLKNLFPYKEPLVVSWNQ